MLSDNENQTKPLFKLNDLGGSANKRTMFSKGDLTTWSYGVRSATEVINVILAVFRVP